MQLRPPVALVLLVSSCAAAPGLGDVDRPANGAVPGDVSAAAAFDPGPVEIGGHVFERRVLANGLRALAVRDDSQPDTVSVFAVYAVGTGVEGPATTGLAHLVEHAMYTGTAQVAAGEHDAVVKGLGGESNAYTRRDYTLYYDHGVPRSALDRVLALEADRMRGLTFEHDAVLHERWRLEVEERDAPDAERDRLELVESVAFRAHTYGAGVRRGGHTHGPRLAVEAVRDFYDRWYHPQRCAVVVVGDVRPDAALAAVEEAFGKIPAGPPAPLVPVEPVDLPGGEARFPSDLVRERFVHAWVGPAEEEDDGGPRDRLALRLLARALDESGVEAFVGGGVHRDLVRLEAVGEDAAASLEALSGGWRERFEGDAFREVFRRERDEMAGELGELELRARPYFSLGALVGVHAARGAEERLARWPEVVRSLEIEDVAAAVERWLAPERRWVVRFLPGGGDLELPDDPGELDAFAQRAEDSGDLELAIAALEQLLELGPNRMNTVIYLYRLGGLRVRLGDLEAAHADLERALAVVDYPAVRDLRDEVVRRIEAGEDGAGTGAGDGAGGEPESAAAEAGGARPERPASGFGVTWQEDLEPALAEEAERMMAWLEDWRGLPFRSDLHVEVVDPEDAGEKLRGWYEPDSDRLVLVENDGGRAARGTLLHEMMHALQDQHFDLDALHVEVDEDTGDARHALQALIEGEAMLAVSELLDYDFEQHTQLPEQGPLDEERFEKIFHYGAGLRFVRALREAGGWGQVEGAWREPPRSTAAIYHPDRWLAGVRVAPPAEGPARGEYALALLLARNEHTRPRAFALAGRLAGDAVVAGPEEDREWWLAFYDRRARDAAAEALERLGREVAAVEERQLRVDLPAGGS